MGPACGASRAWCDMVRCCWCVMRTVRHIVQCCWRAYTAPARHASKVENTYCCPAQHSHHSTMGMYQVITSTHRPCPAISPYPGICLPKRMLDNNCMTHVATLRHLSLVGYLWCMISNHLPRPAGIPIDPPEVVGAARNAAGLKL